MICKKIFILLALVGNLIAATDIAVSYVVRNAQFTDRDQLKELYVRTTAIPGGLVRTPNEITDAYIMDLLCHGINNGLMLVVEHEGILIGAITKYRLEPRNFSHVFTGGSILVDPAFQGRGIGTQLITTFLHEIEEHHNDILRVEIVVRESNPALSLYKRLGFREEGRMEQRSRAKDGSLEADVQMVWMNPHFKDCR